METNNNPEEFKIPDNITDPEELEYFETLKKAFDVAHKKNIPILLMSAYEDINRAFLALQGCKHCMTELVSLLIHQYPGMEKVLQDALVVAYYKKMENLNAVHTAEKLTPQGN